MLQNTKYVEVPHVDEPENKCFFSNWSNLCVRALIDFHDKVSWIG